MLASSSLSLLASRFARCQKALGGAAFSVARLIWRNQRWLLFTDQYLAKLRQKWLCTMLPTRNPTMHRYLN